ncbi:MAG: MazG family protein [Syntrophobacteraceae bacterium]
MQTTKTDRSMAMEEILAIIERLLGENGCPWDRKQTPETVQTYLVEEAHEAAAAVRAANVAEVAEELGDVLFMVFFLARLYEGRGDFTLEDVCALISEKMVRRHPHVFGDTRVDSARQVKDNWEKIKTLEKKESGKSAQPVPDSLPALIRAYRMLSRLSHGKDEDWNDLPSQISRFEKQSGVLSTRVQAGLELEDYFGGLLARLVNIARLKGYRAEDLLHGYLRKLE